MTRRAPYVPTCEACDAPVAPFGFTIAFDEDGRRRTVELWFCRARREVGEGMARTSAELDRPQPRARPEPPRQGVLL